MTKDEQRLHDRIRDEVSPAIALWMKSRFDCGFQLSRVEKELRSAIAVIEIEREQESSN